VNASAPRPVWLCLLLLSLPWSARVAADEDAVPLSAAAVKRGWHGRLDGRHFVAQVRMQMSLAGLEEERRLTVYRDDGDTAHERVLIRFEAPPDLRNIGLLYAEQPDRPNDYFFYQPATRRIRRLPESLADDDIYGIDLEFLGFGVAQTEPTDIESMSVARLGERRAYRLVETAREQNPRFERRITWIDAETLIPLRTEHLRDGASVLVAETREIREIQGVPTPTEMRFVKAREDRKVILRVDSVDYDLEIPAEYFSALALLKSRLAAPRSDVSR
jgi:hypothetical protein